MEITSRQRAYLRSLCNTMPAILFIGKDGVTDNTIQEAENALLARELFKCALQKGAPMTAREACTEICEKTGAAPVQCIGNRFSIYRPKEEDPVIVLP